jgi:ASC-1-like (ASCH) protein
MSNVAIVDVSVREPELTWIREGRKQCEGRLDYGRWATYVDGAVFRIGARLYTVTSISSYRDFGDAWDIHGRNLIPEGVSTAAEARAYYRDFYTSAQIEEHGALIFALQALS